MCMYVKHIQCIWFARIHIPIVTRGNGYPALHTMCGAAKDRQHACKIIVTYDILNQHLYICFA